MEEKKCIKIRGANENNLKHLDVDIRGMRLVVLTGLSDPARVPLLLIRFMRKDSGAIWSRFLMQGSSWGDGEAGCRKH